jgi:small conductance mechanosensitive channel
MNFQSLFPDLISWFFSRGLRIFSIILAAVLANYFLERLVKKGVEKKLVGYLNGKRKRKAETLISIFGGTLKFLIIITSLLMVLPELGVNIAPILAGVGLLGLAIGMAAKNIIADFIAGLFIVLEDQYQIGDRVKIAGLEGVVKEITLRRTILKDAVGNLHSIPNSQIKTVTREISN